MKGRRFTDGEAHGCFFQSEPSANAGTDCAVVWLLRTDVVPILLRLIFSKNFTPGPFKLGRAQPLINVIAILWLSFSVVRSPPHTSATLILNSKLDLGSYLNARLESASTPLNVL